MLKRYIHFLWQKHIEPYDPLGSQLKHAIKSCLAIVVCLALLFFLKIPQAKWTIFASVFVMQMGLGDTKTKQLLRQTLGGTTLIIGVLVSSLVGKYFYPFLLMMAICSFITFYLLKYGPSVFKIAIFILVMILMSGSFYSNLNGSLERGISSLIGTLIALATYNLLWPFNPQKTVRKNLKKGFSNISKYVKFVIDDSLRGNFHRLHRYEKKSKVLESIQHCRRLVATKHTKQINLTILRHQEQLFIQAIALSDLLNKPNSEYTLDIVMSKLGALTPLLTTTIKNTTKENLQQLQTKIKKIAALAKEHCHKAFIAHDISNICYVLNEIQKTLKDIYENKVSYNT